MDIRMVSLRFFVLICITKNRSVPIVAAQTVNTPPTDVLDLAVKPTGNVLGGGADTHRFCPPKLLQNSVKSAFYNGKLNFKIERYTLYILALLSEQFHILLVCVARPLFNISGCFEVKKTATSQLTGGERPMKNC